MKEADNILRILIEAKEALNQNDPYKLKQLSNQTIHTATIYQDPDNIIVAVLIYTLGKLIERDNYKQMDSWNEFYSSLLKNFDLSIKGLKENNIEKFRLGVGKIRNSINNLDTNLSKYIKDVFQKAEINKAFKIYEHGLSAEKTAELLGVSLWDMASYIGQSSISEAKIIDSMPVNKRIKIAEDIFS